MYDNCIILLLHCFNPGIQNLHASIYCFYLLFSMAYIKMFLHFDNMRLIFLTYLHKFCQYTVFFLRTLSVSLVSCFYLNNLLKLFTLKGGCHPDTVVRWSQ